MKNIFINKTSIWLHFCLFNSFYSFFLVKETEIDENGEYIGNQWNYGLNDKRLNQRNREQFVSLSLWLCVYFVQCINNCFISFFFQFSKSIFECQSNHQQNQLQTNQTMVHTKECRINLKVRKFIYDKMSKKSNLSLVFQLFIVQLYFVSCCRLHVE